MSLKASFPIPTLDGIVLDTNHVYHIGDEKAPLSVTSLIDLAKGEHKFDADQVARKNLASWRSNASSRFFPLTVGRSDEEAVEAIKATWLQNADQGTRMHALLESVANDEAVGEDQLAEFGTELQQFEALRFRHPELEFVRTELSVFARDRGGRVAVAGQIDALVRNRSTGKLIVIDYKRISRTVNASAQSYGKFFLGSNVPLNDFHVYSLQVSLYRELLRLSSGLECDEAYLLQLHAGLPEGRLIRAADMSKEATELLKSLNVDCTR